MKPWSPYEYRHKWKSTRATSIKPLRGINPCRVAPYPGCASATLGCAFKPLRGTMHAVRSIAQTSLTTKGPIMPQSLAHIYLHIVFSTKDRYPFLRDAAIRDEAHRYLGGACNGLGCPVIQV